MHFRRRNLLTLGTCLIAVGGVGVAVVPEAVQAQTPSVPSAAALNASIGQAMAKQKALLQARAAELRAAVASSSQADSSRTVVTGSSSASASSYTNVSGGSGYIDATVSATANGVTRTQHIHRALGPGESATIVATSSAVVPQRFATGSASGVLVPPRWPYAATTTATVSIPAPSLPVHRFIPAETTATPGVVARVLSSILSWFQQL